MNEKKRLLVPMVIVPLRYLQILLFRLQTAERLSETKKDIRNREETFQYCIAISAKFKCELLSYSPMSNQFYCKTVKKYCCSSIFQ